jgi:PAS domain S-box-containing protein
LLDQLVVPGQIVVEPCDNGLVDCAVPIIVQGKHIASLATGQMFLAPPDIQHFREQARALGCDEEAYMNALGKVPVISEEKLKSITALLGEIALIISELGYARLEGKEEEARLEHEIEKRTQVEQALLESRLRYKAIFDQTFQLIGLLSPDGILIEVNKTALEFAKIMEEDVLHKPFWETAWWQHSTKVQEQIRASVEEAGKGKFIRYETTIFAGDGSIRCVDFSLKPVLDVKGKVVLLIPEGRDITERKNADEELRSYREYLEKLVDERTGQLVHAEKMASLGQLAAGVAHEINNPITYITSNLSVLKGYVASIMNVMDLYKRLEEERRTLPGAGGSEALLLLEEFREGADLEDILADLRRLIAETDQGAERVKRIVLDLRTFAREDKELPEEVDINSIIDVALSIVWNQLKYNVEVVKECGDVPRIMGYPRQLEQVFINLLVNAAQAITLKGQIVIRTKQEKKHVIVEVIDTGCGIREHELPRIFEPFFTTKEVGKGTGLGLSIAYGIIKKHLGEIAVKSSLGVGTTFTIKLPVDTQTSDARHKP